MMRAKLMTFFPVIGIIGGIITFLLFIFKMFVVGLIGVGILCILLSLLARLSSEEWAIFVLKRHGGGRKHTHQVGCCLKALSRLEKKGIVTIEDGFVQLVDANYPCIFDEPDD